MTYVGRGSRGGRSKGQNCLLVENRSDIEAVENAKVHSGNSRIAGLRIAGGGVLAVGKQSHHRAVWRDQISRNLLEIEMTEHEGKINIGDPEVRIGDIDSGREVGDGCNIVRRRSGWHGRIGNRSGRADACGDSGAIGDSIRLENVTGAIGVEIVPHNRELPRGNAGHSAWNSWIDSRSLADHQPRR